MARGSASSSRAPKRKRVLATSSDDDDDDVIVSSDASDEEYTDAKAKGGKTRAKVGKQRRSSTKKAPPSKAKKSASKATNWKVGDPGGLDRLEELVVAEGLRGSGEKATLESLGIRNEVTEVREMGPDSVLDEIELAVAQVIKSVMAGRGFEYHIPSRTESNQRYIAELDRIVLKNDNKMVRSFVNVNTVKKAAITTRAMELIHQVLRKRIHITKRDLFYTDVKLFVDQKHSDAVLDDLACMLGCTRTSLHVVASEKGIVVGKLTFRDDGDFIDCSKMGVGGKAIPPYTDRVTEITSDAKFILLVEKDAAFMRLAEDRFYNTYPCVIITAKGQPDVATRMFLRRLQAELNIPVLGLVDSDPYGLKILSVYMSGSKAMSYDSESLTTRGIHWLGVRPSDLDRYDIPEQCRLPLTETDIKTGKALLKEDFICKNPEWVKELELMLETKQKAEIQALSSFGFQYLTHTYLPQKIANGDWI